MQTPETVFAIDLDQAPTKTGPEPAPTQLFGSARRRSTSRLARLVDIAFHTYEHHDHVDYEITKTLCESGKTVVVTASREHWQDELGPAGSSVLEQTLPNPIP